MTETYDIVIAGCGISGLLLGSELAPHCRLLLLEKRSAIPRNKYWLTNASCAELNSELKSCIDTTYPYFDFIAYDNTRVRINGQYHLWNTDKLIRYLEEKIRIAGAQILINHTFHSYRYASNMVIVHSNDKEIATKLLIDCMGYGSPIITAKSVVTIIGYFLMCGKTFKARRPIDPIGLHNLMIQNKPTYFEAFPTKGGLVHTAMIVPARNSRGLNGLTKDFNYVVKKTRYAELLEDRKQKTDTFFGIIPVGKVNKYSLERIFFYGEAGQINPATSATGFTRMLYTYRETARFLLERLASRELSRRSLNPSAIAYMSRGNRFFQEALFRRLLDFNSDDFKALIEEMSRYGDGMVNDMIFADFKFHPLSIFRIAMKSISSPRSILGKCVINSILRAK